MIYCVGKFKNKKVFFSCNTKDLYNDNYEVDLFWEDSGQIKVFDKKVALKDILDIQEEY